MSDDGCTETVMDAAQSVSLAGRPVIVDVRIDYSKSTRFTKGIIKTNLGRMSVTDKARMLSRAAWRHAVPPKNQEQAQ